MNDDAAHESTGASWGSRRRERRFTFSTKTRKGREDLAMLTGFGVLLPKRWRRDRTGRDTTR